MIIFDFRVPTDKRGVKRETITANIDMSPTMLSLAGVSISENMDGVNLVPLLKKKEGIKRESVTLINMWGNDEIQEMGVLTKDWKYIYWQYEDERMQATEELYNIGKDRLEMTNQVNNTECSKVLKKMQKLYDHHLNELVKGVVDYHDYQKYKVLFNRESTVSDKNAL